MQFSDFGFDARILKSIHHLGFETATEIQSRAIPEAMAGKDLLASSQTGSGKTLAYLLPALHRVYKVKALSKKDPRVLVLAPTRELAKQVFSQLRLMLAGSGMKSVLILGGENFNDQHKDLQKNPHFVVATPGRLADHLTQRNLYLEGLELLILDEADRMLDLGFAPQLKQIDAAANHRLRQTLFFSATLDDAGVNEMAQLLLREPRRVAVGSGKDEHQDIQQHFYLCDHLDHKEAILAQILAQSGVKQAIVFSATRSDTVRLAEKLAEQGVSAQALNGDLTQTQRNKVMDGFSRGHFTVLVTTDVASRGIDIANVSHVVNFDLPKQTEEYIHRTGRTGRAGFSGDAFSLIGPKDWHNFKALEAFLGRNFEFSVFAGLEPTFAGLKPKTSPKRRIPEKKISQPSGKKVSKSVKGKGPKRAHTNEQHGFEPFRLPKKTSE